MERLRKRGEEGLVHNAKGKGVRRLRRSKLVLLAWVVLYTETIPASHERHDRVFFFFLTLRWPYPGEMSTGNPDPWDWAFQRGYFRNLLMTFLVTCGYVKSWEVLSASSRPGRRDALDPYTLFY